MKIEILGTGCSKCKKTFESVEKAVKNLGIDAEIVKVENVQDIMKYGIMITPAVAINGEVKIVGKIPTQNQIAEWTKNVK